MHFVNCTARLYKYELVVFLSAEITHFCHLFPACACCLGTVWATVHLALTLCPCEPPVHLFIPQGSCVASARSFRVCTNLSLVSTSKQKRLSMDSVFRRMQDLSVRIVEPCGKSRKLVGACDEDTDRPEVRKGLFGIAGAQMFVCFVCHNNPFLLYCEAPA